MNPSLLAALILVESSGNPNPPPGAAGELGPLQISAAVVEDVNQWHGWKFRHSQMTNLEIARIVAPAYMLGWAKRQKVAPTPENLARIYNGGPGGWRKSATLPYWRKVQRAMAQIEKEKR